MKDGFADESFVQITSADQSLRLTDQLQKKLKNEGSEILQMNLVTLSLTITAAATGVPTYMLKLAPKSGCNGCWRKFENQRCPAIVAAN